MNASIELMQLAEDLKKKAEDDQIDKILVGAAVLFKKNILLIQRSEQDDFLPDYIEIPGGGLKNNEDVLTGMQRELYEETRLTAAQIFCYIGSFDAVSSGGKTVRQFNFLVEPENDKLQLSQEHSRHIWWNTDSVRELDSMRMIETMKAILRKAVAILKEPCSTGR